MTVTDVRKDPAGRTMTITAEFAAPVDRIWQMWADPRLLERWWGPPGYPATFGRHDLEPGGAVTYYMTSPEGEQYHGYWDITSVDAPKQFEFEDGFADADGNANTEMPTTSVLVRLDEQPDGTTRMTIESTFPTTEAMKQLLAMGMDEGMQAALAQIDDLLAA